MKYPNINQTIASGSKLLHLLLIFSAAWGVAKICWWLMNPLGYDIPSNTYVNTQSSDGIALGITNRAPFGVIIVKKEEKSEPSIVSQIKVTGVYAGGAKNSIAFLLINSKNSIAMIGESVLGATLTGIRENGITLRLNNQDIVINVDGSNTTNTANTPMTASSNSSQQPFSPPAQPNGNQPPPTSQPSTSMAPNNSGGDGDSLADKRRKMIEAFQRQNANADGDNNNANNSNNGNSQQPTN